MRTILALTTWLLVGLAQAIPGVLIVQERMPQDRFGDPNVMIANMLAEGVEKEGLFAPVVWSITDPIFRSAINDNLIRVNDNVPSLEQAQEVAKKLKLDHIIFVRAYQFGNNVMGRIMLYKGGKMTWKDPEKSTEILDPATGPPIVGKDAKGNPTQTGRKQNTLKLEDRPMSVMGPNGLNIEDSAASLVRSWISFIKVGPLKGQASQPKILTPEPLPGNQTNVPTDPIGPKVLAKVDNKQLLTDLDTLIRGGQTVQGILMLRDAVDAEPQDVERRIALVRTLLLMAQPELAAKEARRAAQLIPDRVELRAMAARAWMQAGREDEAMADLNEAVARDPNSLETRSLLAEVNLSKLLPNQAIEHLDAVIKEKPTAEAWYRRAICQALLGNKDLATSDLAKAKEIGLAGSSQEVAVRYGTTLDILDKSLMGLGNDLRSLFSLAQVRRTDPQVKQGHADSLKLVMAWQSFLAQTSSPNIHRSSHDRRLLALNLLSQSLTDLGTYLATNDESLLADARINMGEALKQFSASQASYRTEIGGTAKGVGT